MALNLKELRKLSKKELWERYNQKANNVEDSLNYYRDEIERRERNKQTRLLIALTAVAATAAGFSILDLIMN